MKELIYCALCGLSFVIGGVYTEYKLQGACHEEVKPYKELMIACLNNGEFYFPDTLEAFRCDTQSLGRL